jgi:hypothetical protein
MGGYGRVGNQAICAWNTFQYAVRCRGSLTLPAIEHNVFGYVNDFGPNETMYFDFANAPGDEYGIKCESHRVDSCRDAFYLDSPPLPDSAYTSDTAKVLFRCSHKYFNVEGAVKECPAIVLNDRTLYVQMRNGDIFESEGALNTYGQPPMCSIIAAIFHGGYEKVVVTAEFMDPTTRGAGPLFKILHAISNVFPATFIFPPGDFTTHFGMRQCAVNLHVPHTTLNIMNQHLLNVRRVYNPYERVCPMLPMWMAESEIQEISTFISHESTVIDWHDGFLPGVEHYLKLLTHPCGPWVACHGLNLNPNIEPLNDRVTYGRNNSMLDLERMAQRYSSHATIVFDLSSNIRYPFCSIIAALFPRHLVSQWAHIVIVTDTDVPILPNIPSSLRQVGGTPSYLLRMFLAIANFLPKFTIEVHNSDRNFILSEAANVVTTRSAYSSSSILKESVKLRNVFLADTSECQGEQVKHTLHVLPLNWTSPLTRGTPLSLTDEYNILITPCQHFRYCL